MGDELITFKATRQEWLEAFAQARLKLLTYERDVLQARVTELEAVAHPHGSGVNDAQGREREADLTRRTNRAEAEVERLRAQVARLERLVGQLVVRLDAAEGSQDG